MTKFEETIDAGPGDPSISKRGVDEERRVSTISSQSGDRVAVFAVVLLLIGIYWLTMGGHTYSSDGETYLASTRSLMHHTTALNPPPDLDAVVSYVLHKNGGFTSFAPIGTLLLFSPGYVLGKLASIPFPSSSREEVVRLVYLAANPVMMAITAGLLLLLCRALDASRRSAILLALTFGLATWAWRHGMTDFSEPGTAMVLTAATLMAVRWWKSPTLRRAFLVGLLSGAAVLTRPSMLLFVPMFLAAGLLTRPDNGSPARTPQIVVFGAGGVLPGAMYAINAYLRFGSPFDNGYPNLAYTTPIYEGVFGEILSPGKGLFWYAPICVVALFGLRRAFIAQRRYVLLVGIMLVVHLAVYGRFEIWSGENAFGPRYMLSMLPLLVALVAPVVDSGREWVRGAKVAAAVGFLVPGLLGSTMYFNAVYTARQPQVIRDIQIDAPTPFQQYFAWNFQPRSSPLVLQLRSVPDLVRNTGDRLSGEPGGITPMPVAYEERIHWYARAIELDMWWAWWSARGNAAAGYLFLLAPTCALLLAARAFRRLRSITQIEKQSLSSQ